MGLNTVERQANQRTIQQAESLRTTGITLSDEETAALLRQNTAYAEQREAVSVLARTQAELGRARNIGASPVQTARIQQAAASSSVDRASELGLIGAEEKARLERNITAAYAEQVNPLLKTSALLRERAGYVTGVASSGRALAQVERDITRAQAEGVGASAAAISGLRAQAREVDKLEKAYGTLKEGKGLFNNFIGGFGLLLGAGASLKALDETTNVRNLVGVTSPTKDNQSDVTDQIYKTAIATHSEVEDTAKLYTRLQLAGARYNIGQQQTLALTKEVNEQIRLSGTSQGEATRAVLDFAHAIGSGNVQFRELRALTQQAPFVAVQIAKGLTELAKNGTEQGKEFAERAKKAGVDVDKRDINIGSFKELTSKGALTSGNIIEAQRLEADSTQKAFEKLQPTIAQSVTDLKSFFLEYVDGFNKASGAGAGIANLIEFVGKNLKTIIPTAIVLGSVLAGLFIAEKVKEFTNLISVFGSKLLGIKSGYTAQAEAIGAANIATAEATTLAVTEAKAIDGVTAALIRQNLARAGGGGAITPAGAAAAKAESAGVTFGKRGVGVAAGAAEGAAVEGAEVAATAGAAEAGAAGVAGLGAIAAGATLAIPVILGLGAAWLTLKDSIDLAGEGTTLAYKNQTTGATEALQGTITLGDTVGGIFDLIGSKAEDSSSRQKAASTDAAKTDAAAKQAQLDKAKSTFDQTGNYFDQLHSGLLKGIVSFVTSFIVGATYIGQTFQITFLGIYAAAEKLIQQVVNLVGDLYNNTVVPVLNAAKSVGIGNGATAVGKVQIGDGQRAYASALKSRDDTTRNLVQQLPNALAGAIVKSAVNRQTQRPSSVTNNDGDGLGDVDAKNKKDKKPKKDPLDDQYDELVKKALPAVAAITAFSKAIETIDKALSKGLIDKTVALYNTFSKAHPEDALGSLSTPELTARLKSQEERQLQDKLLPGNGFDREQTEKQGLLNNTSGTPFSRTVANDTSAEIKKEADALALTTEQYKLLRPEREAAIQAELRQTSVAEQGSKVREALAAENAERDRQKSQLGETTELISAQSDAYKIYGDAIRQGVPGAQAAYDQRVRDNLSFIAYKENIDKTKAAYDALVAPAKTYQDTIVNLNNLLDSGSISLAKYNEQVRGATSSLLAANKDGFSGFERGLLDVKKETEDTASDMEKTFKDAYNNIQSGFSSLFTGGSLKDAAHKVFEGLTNDLSQTLFHKLTDPLISQVGSKFGIPGFGDKKLAAQRADITATNVYVNGADASSLGNRGLLPNGGGGIPGILGGDTSALTTFGAPGNGGIGDLASGLGPASSLFGPNSGLFGVGAANDNSLFGGIGQSSLSSLFGGPAANDNSLLGGGGGLGALTGILGGAAAAGGAGGGSGGILGGLKSLSPLASLFGGGASGLKSLSPIASLFGGGGGGAGGLTSLLGGGGAGGLSSLLQFLPLFGFATGGSFDVAGSGGTDSKIVSFKATPGENVTVSTPAQQRQNQGGEAPTINNQIVNTLDPQSALDAMSTGPGFNVILNHVQSNPEQIKRALGL